MKYISALFLLLGACGAPVQNKKLIIYTSANPEVAEFYGEIFAQDTGVKPEFVFGSTGEIIKRVELEKASPLADLQWGGSEEYADRLGGALQPYLTPNEDAFIPAYKNYTGLFTSVTVIPNVLLVNTNLYPGAVKGYQGLLAPELKGRIAFADPALSSSSFEHLVNMLYAMGKGDPEKGWPFVEKFVANLDGKLLASSPVLYKGVGGGEYAVGLTVEFGAVSEVKSGSPVKIVYMEEGVTAKNYGAFLLRGAKNEAAAKAFIDFLTSKKIQDSFARFDSRGVRRDAAAGQNLPLLGSIKLTAPDSALVRERKDEWLKKFKDLLAKSAAK